MTKYTEQSMLKAVHNHFGDYKYCLKNSFVFRYDWESDFFCVNREGYSFEIEVKISRSDFKNDFKKEKHKLFVDKTTKRLIPNRFYYAVPEGLIKENELPSYAGLIIVKGSHAKVVKRAPYLHKKKEEFRKILCDKFYYNWLAQKKKLGELEYSLENAKTRISKLGINRFIIDGRIWDLLKVDFETKKVIGRLQPYMDMKIHKYVETYEIKEFDLETVKFN